jgi:hypothetical protein
VIMPRIRLAVAASRTALGTIAMGAFIAVAACGNSVAGHPASAGGPDATPMAGSEASAGVALCTHMSKLTSVAVRRMMTLHVLEPDLVLPLGTTIREPRLVRGLAAALCGLPRSRGARLNCPPHFAGSLRLVFAAGGRLFRPVTVQVSGCGVVAGLGPTRRVPSSALWRILDRALAFKFPQGTASPK